MAGTAKITEKPIINPALADYLFLMQNGSVVRAQVSTLSDLLNSDISGASIAVIGTGEPGISTTGHAGSLYYDSTGNKLYLCTSSDATGNAWQELQGSSSGGTGNLSGPSDPTTETEATVGQIYVNTTTGKIFICMEYDSEAGTYTWQEAAGGSGSSDTDSVLRLRNSTGSSSFTVMDTEESALIGFTVTSLDSDGNETGDITCTWYVGGVRKAVRTVQQGLNSFDVFSYLSVGTTNTVRLTVEDTYGATKSLTWYVTVSSFTLTWNVEEMAVYNGTDLGLRLIPTGEGTKTVIVTVDGVTFSTSTVTTTGRTLSVTIPAQSHGAHIITAYMQAEVNGDTVTTDPLTHTGIWVTSGVSTPIIGLSAETMTVSQYATAQLKYLVYNPSSETATVYLYEGSTLKNSLTVGRSVQTWAYRVTEIGDTTLKVVCGSAEKTCVITATDIGIDINPVTTGLVLDVDPTGHSNQEASRASFGYDDANGTRHPFVFSSNFDWTNGGFQVDDDGVTAFVIRRGTYVQFDRSLFNDNAATSGKEIKIIFKCVNARDYDAEVLNCKSSNIGLVMTAQAATLSSELESIDVPYCEEKKIEMDINIHSKTDGAYAVVWLEGVPSRVVNYTNSDNWQQSIPAAVEIGSDECDVWLYRMKLYENTLSRYEVLDNFIADCADPVEMVDRANRNDIFTTSGAIDRAKLAQMNPNLRVIHLTAQRMTTGKSDSVTCDIEHVYVNGGAGDNWTATGAKFKAQGTSSLQYGLSAFNLDVDLSSATDWTDSDGNAMTGYSMTENSIPVAYFNLKANVASSENANNVVLADDYNTFNPCKAPGYSSDTRIRDTVEGHPCAIFFTNSSSETITVGARSVAAGETIFYANGDMNNSKKNTAVFGQDNSTYPLQCCIEITNNNNDPVRFKAEIPDTETWDGADGTSNFEPRYPSTLTDAMKTAFRTMHSWVVSTDTDAATDEYIGNVVLNGITYTSDSVAYRKAKFKYELENYFDVDSLLFHYLFTERHLMVDNRAKNTFVSYEPTSNGYRWNFRCDYDNDTASGNDNSGGLTFTYGMEDVDRIGTAYVFNAADSVLWCNLRDLFYNELRTMYTDLESEGAWSASRFVAKMAAHKSARPEAAVIEDMYCKYILPYLNSSETRYLGMLYGNKDDQLLQFETYQEPYIASKYVGSLATSDAAELRANATSAERTISIVPYSDIYVAIHFGNAGTSRVRAKRGVPAVIECPADSLNDLEASIYSASRLTDLGDLSSMLMKSITVNTASKLLRFQLGSGEAGYQNINMYGPLSVGNNPLLQYMDIRGIPYLEQAMDLSALTSLEEFYATGSGITGVTFPTGGPLKTVTLPAIRSLIAVDLTDIETFTIDPSALQVVWVEGCSGIDTQALVEGSTSIVRGRLTDVDWDMETADPVLRLLETAGIDSEGNNIVPGEGETGFVLTGALHLDVVTNDELTAIQNAWYPGLAVTYSQMVSAYTVTFKDGSGNTVWTETVREGASAVNPVAAGYISAPTKEPTVQYTYSYGGWDTSLDNITQDTTITAVFTSITRKYTVNWYSGTTLLYSKTVAAYASVVYGGETPTPPTDQIWAGWDALTNSIISDLNVHAVFISAAEPAGVPATYDYLYSDDPDDASAYSAAEFYWIIQNGRAEAFFSLGDKIKICPSTTVFADTEIICRLESFYHYKLADGSGWAGPFFGMLGIMNATHRMNATNTNVGGWDSSEMRSYLNETIFPELPPLWRSLIQPVQVLASAGNTSATITTSIDKLFLRSTAEVGFNTGDVPYCNEIAADTYEGENYNSPAFSCYTDNNSRIKKTYNNTGTAQYWWLRSAESTSSTQFRGVYHIGNSNTNSATVAYGVSFGFCLL